MEVVAALVGFDHLFLARDHGGCAQFDLRVIGHHESPASRCREARPEFSSPDVLEVRGFAGEPSGIRARWLKSAVDAVVGLDAFEEAFGLLGRFLGGAEREDLRDDRFIVRCLERFLVCVGQVDADTIEGVAELLGARHIECRHRERGADVVAGRAGECF